MINIVIGTVILVLSVMRDKSVIKRNILNKQKPANLDERGTDDRVELYKTLSYFSLGLFWLFFKHIRYIIPWVILWNILAFIHHLRKPEIIRKACLEIKSFPTLNRMFLVCGTGIGFLILMQTLKINKKGILIGVLFTLVLFIGYLIGGLQAKARITGILNFVLPAFIFVMGSILVVNVFYGAKKIDKVETVVEHTSNGMRTSGFYIPKEDALDGETYFSASITHKKMGDRVEITEYEGCLGIRWFIVSWIEEESIS